MLRRRLQKSFLRSFFNDKCKCEMKNISSFPEKTKSEIRGHLERFTGGSVDLIKRQDGVAVVLLNQSQKKNAITGKMMADLEDAVEELKSWTQGKGIIVKGASNNFCSGGDLDFVRQISTPEQGFMMSTFMQGVLNEFERLPMISVALIEGSGALGGGAELSMACDFRLITETCKGIGFVHGRMGITPAWGGTNRLVKKLGYTKALDLLSTANICSPSECLNLGLANEIVPEKVKDVEDFALEWLKKRVVFDATVLGAIKTSTLMARDEPGCYEFEKQIFAPFWGGQINRQALQKNIKHRPQQQESSNPSAD